MFSDPFGLCTGKDGQEVPASQCREITKAEGAKVYQAAQNSGQWTYCRTPASKDVAHHKGDCTDFTEAAMVGAGMPALATTANAGAVRTWEFAGDTKDFTKLGSASDARQGDIVEGGQHAGIATGRTRTLANGSVQVQAIQNGTTNGTGNMWFTAPSVYRRLIPTQP